MKGGYVDGFVFPVPEKNVDKYKKMAREGCKAWMKCGALAYFECMGDDLTPKASMGFKPRSFNDVVKAKPNETVWFSFIVFTSRAHRDQVNKKVMKYFADKYADMKDFEMPNNPKKMAYGGFKAVIQA